MEESGIEVSVKEPEPELSFVQKLNLRELEDQRSTGAISEEKYKQKKNECLRTEVDPSEQNKKQDLEQNKKQDLDTPKKTFASIVASFSCFSSSEIS